MRMGQKENNEMPVSGPLFCRKPFSKKKKTYISIKKLHGQSYGQDGVIRLTGLTERPR